jgi:nitrite reductase/ring-hydroxylating ferredoxin subunit
MAKMFDYKLCHEKDLENNSMKEYDVDLGGDGDSSKKYKVLLVKSDNQFQCLPTKCTHYNAPLANGILYKGRLRCFAHGAAFNVLTGDIEDYPGPDCLPKYKVSIDKTTGFVILHVTQQELEITKRLRTSQQSKTSIEMPILKSLPRCLIIGSGAAGLLCVDTFREAGWSSNVTMITSDAYPPYDRPKLSKSPDLPFDKIGLRDVAFFQENNINFHMNQLVETIDFEARVAVCKDGRTFAYDRLVIATGLRANSGSKEANLNLKGT